MSSNQDYSFHNQYPQYDYEYAQDQYGYLPHELDSNYSEQPLEYGGIQISGSSENHTPQTSQGPSTPVYLYPPPTQHHSLGHEQAMYWADQRVAWPAAESSPPDRATVHTAGDQYGYSLYQPGYGYSQPPLENSGIQMTDGLEVHAHQISQDPALPVYPHPSSMQHHLVDQGGTMYRSDQGVAQPATEGLVLSGAVVHTASTFTATASYPIVPSPDREPSLPLSVNSEQNRARRVAPRYDGPESTASDSHRHSRSSRVIHGRGPSIPQDRYQNSSISSPEQHPRIPFNLENSEQVGIPIIDILNRRDAFSHMQDRRQAFSHMGKKTFTLRVLWPGYKPWSKTIAALDWTKERAPITRAKAAEAVAVAIRDLFDEYRDKPYDLDRAEWNVGPNGIRLDQVCLVALHHVSKGSWQPELCLLTPST